MKQIPSDLKILKRIYEDYYQTFISFDENFPRIKNKYYIKIDFQSISKELNVDPDIIVGRLINLDSKYGFKYNDSSRVNLFNINKTESLDADTINFPLIATILSDLIDKERKYWVPIAISAFSFLISIASLLFSIFKK
ncbi:MAG: hypothetical protein ABSA01_02540 [Anaerolineales bacterium]|jgi:hypothetical protein